MLNSGPNLEKWEVKLLSKENKIDFVIEMLQ